MIFHALGVPKTHPKSISKSIPKPDRFWTLLEPYFGSFLASRWLLHGFQSSQDGSKTTQGASKTPLICRQSCPAPPKTPLRMPKTPPRLSKSLQDGSGSLQDASQSSPEEVLEPPRRLQELSRGAFRASSCGPAASSLWPASGLGGMREALTISRQVSAILGAKRLPKGSPRRSQIRAQKRSKLKMAKP